MLKLAELKAMDSDQFTGVLGGIFEHSSWVPAETADRRPFRSIDQLHEALCQTVMEASEDKHLALIRAHPDLVGKATLTAESAGEQAAAGLGQLSQSEIAQFQVYNAHYRERFDFPFVICARSNRKDAILKAFPIRLQNSRPQEIETALHEIFKIAELRLKDLIANE